MGPDCHCRSLSLAAMKAAYLSSKRGKRPALLLPALIGIGVRDPKARQYLGFEALHLKSLRIREVIIP